MKPSRLFWARYHADKAPDTYPESQAYANRWSELRPIYARTLRQARETDDHFAPEGTARVQVCTNGDVSKVHEHALASVERVK